MLYEQYSIDNLAKSVERYYSQHRILPPVGQVFTLYQYAANILELLRGDLDCWKNAFDVMAWALVEYDFMLVQVNFIDPENEEEEDENGMNNFYFKVHEAGG